VFQSSPAPKGGRYVMTVSSSQLIDEFQSSPAPKGGRYDGCGITSNDHHGFNPRPPRRAGATFERVERLSH